MACPIAKGGHKKRVQCTRYKNTDLLRCHFAPLWPRRQNFNTCDLSSAYICLKFLSGSVKVCGSIREKLILSKHITLLCICMTAYRQAETLYSRQHLFFILRRQTTYCQFKNNPTSPASLVPSKRGQTLRRGSMLK